MKINVTREAAIAVNRDSYYGHGKLEILPKVTVSSIEDIATLYTPGVGHAVRDIAADAEALHELTSKDNTVAVVTDGTAVLGYGAVGPRAGAPVMEGKAIMFKMLAGIDSIALCVDARDGDHLVDIMCALEPSFGGYNLEDVSAPTCFHVMKELERRLPIPVLHDDQYGTATVITAALTNAFKVTGREPADQRVVVNGAGAAGTATIDLLRTMGIGDIIVNDVDGILRRGVAYRHAHWEELAKQTNAEARQGALAEAMRGADVFIGVSKADLVSGDMVASMAPHPIVFTLANPVPEVMPEISLAAGAAVIATGRYDYPNQCNNVIGFPGLLRGALDTRAKRISPEACLAAAKAIAADVPDADLRPDRIVPTPLSATLYPAVAEATARAIVAQGDARFDPGAGWSAENTRRLRGLVAERQAELSRIIAREKG